MADENTAELLEEVEPNDSSEENTGLTLEAAIAELAKVRREAAKHRTDKQKIKKDLEEFQAWKDSQKSELERAKDEVAEARKEANELRRSQSQLKAAKKAGLDLDLADRIRGDDEAEMLEDAKLLASKSRPATGYDLGAGERGSPVGNKDTNWLADFMNGK